MSNLIVGPPATGNRFYNREDLINLIWQRLETSSLLFVAPRRFGKTSVMLNLRDKPAAGFRPVYMDLEWFESPTQFLVEVTAEMVKCVPAYRSALAEMQKIPDEVMDFLGNFDFKVGLNDPVSNSQVAELKIGMRERMAKSWQELGKTLLRVTDDIDGRVLLMLDELPLMTKRMLKGKKRQEVEIFLRWLRSLRQGSDEMKNIRFIVGGSIGIEHVLVEAGAGEAMNDLDRVKVEPFKPDVAKALVGRLFMGERFDVDSQVVEQVLREVEVFVPFFLQLLVSETCKLATDRKANVTASLVSEAYRDRVVSAESRTYFEHFHSRLRDYYEPAEEAAAKEMLKYLALEQKLTMRDLRGISLQAAPALSDDAFSHLLGDLENDFYLKREDDGFAFHTKILRDWWIRFYSF